MSAYIWLGLILGVTILLALLAILGELIEQRQTRKPIRIVAAHPVVDHDSYSIAAAILRRRELAGQRALLDREDDLAPVGRVLNESQN